MESFFGRSLFGSFYRASMGEFGQKLFALPKICLLLHLYGVEPPEELFEIAVDREVFHFLLRMLLPQPSLEEKRA